jgi:hypothetical protein
MSDLGSDLDEDDVIDLHPEQREPADDGWGADPSDVAAPADVATDLTEAPAETEPAWDGWGDPPTDLDQPEPLDRGRAEQVDVPEPGPLTDAPADVPDETLPEAPVELDEPSPEDELALEAARAEVDAAFQDASDLLADTAELSDFQQKVAQSEAQEVESLTEAEDYARENLGIDRVDFEHFDQRTANDVNATLEVLQDKYPEVGGLDYLGTIQVRNQDIKAERPDLVPGLEEREPDLLQLPTDGTVAAALHGVEGFDGIALNDTWSGSYEDSNEAMARDEAQHGSAEGTGSMSGVVAHEFGHLVENHLEATGRFGEVEAEIDALRSKGVEAVKSEISNYAWKSRQELFAEVFAEYQMNPHPSETALRIGAIVDRHLRG